MTCQMTIPIHRPIRVQAVLIQTTKSWAHLGSVDASNPWFGKLGAAYFQHKRTKTLHLLPMGSGNSFLCGREKTADYDPFLLMVHSEEWKCRHCDRSRPIRSVDGMCHALDLALKTIKRA